LRSGNSDHGHTPPESPDGLEERASLRPTSLNGCADPIRCSDPSAPSRRRIRQLLDELLSRLTQFASTSDVGHAGGLRCTFVSSGRWAKVWLQWQRVQVRHEGIKEGLGL
jgi:hypothetical protein